jgi:hypothetical protein
MKNYFCKIAKKAQLRISEVIGGNLIEICRYRAYEDYSNQIPECRRRSLHIKIVGNVGFSDKYLVLCFFLRYKMPNLLDVMFK